MRSSARWQRAPTSWSRTSGREHSRPGNLDTTISLPPIPGSVLVRVSGYGQTGPYRDRPGFGVIGESMGGLRYLTGEPGRLPVRVGVSIGDSLAALHGALGAMMALHQRARNGGRGPGG